MEKTKKTFGQIWAELTSEQAEYLKGYINRQRQDAVKEYKAEQLKLNVVVGQSEQLSRCKCGEVVKVECSECLDTRLISSLES